MSEREHSPTVAVQFGRTRLVVQVSILAIVVWIGSYLMLYADRHNDERYLSKAEYEKDRKTDAALREQTQALATWRMDTTDKKLDEISRDIKTLLRRPLPGENNPHD